MLKYLRLAVACAAVLAAALPAIAKPPMEAFGDVAEVRAAELSPDGKRVTFIRRKDGKDTLILYDFATKSMKVLATITEIRARDVQFVGDNYIVLTASTAKRTFGFEGKYEYSGAFAFDLSTDKFIQLLTWTAGIYPAQSGLGRIVGVDPDGKSVYMPVYMGAKSSEPSLDLLKVNLESGRGARIMFAEGLGATTDWITNTSGQAIAREDFNEKRQLHEIRTRATGGEWRIVYTEKTDMPSISLVGASADGKSLVTVQTGDSDFLSLYSMSLADGAITGPILQRPGSEIAGVLRDGNRVVHGVRYSGMYPTYDMFDPALDADIKALQDSMPESSVWLDSWSADFSKLLFFVEGGKAAERYLTFDRTTKTATGLVNARPDITAADVGEVITMEYKARDGLKIPGLLTWPTGVAKDARKNLPLVVLPHGGPESYDAVGFDWLAQFLANEGYLVLQPNFRGSAGFGAAFAEAGRGEWGRKMQDDITDGANALVKMGWADPNRMCTVGWSYGGYAALAGGALTPDFYKCVVSIAGVSNLREMLRFERDKYGRRSATLAYWEMLIGDADKDKDAIDAVSPARLAKAFKAPVLLIHGSDDTIVESRQSNLMADALKAADKSVDYIRIKGDDHSLVDNESRRTTLKAISDFLTKHIGKPAQ